MTPAEGAIRLDAAELGIPPGCCRAPALPDWIVGRDGLVKRLLGCEERLVVITAPAGYGKTTLTRLWDQADHRPFAWVHLEPGDRQVRHLVQHIGVALQETGPLAADVVRVLRGAARSVDTDLVPALGRELVAHAPLVLVLEDVHLATPDADRVVDGLLAWLPDGSQLALVGRTIGWSGLARRRMDGDVCELDRDDLALDEPEGAALLRASGALVDDSTAAKLVARTEGWAGGLHLAAVAGSQRRDGALPLPTGRDRYIADYLVDEVLGSLRPELTTFLEESATLDRLSADVLDELLGTDDSAARLAEFERVGAAFLVPLDDQRSWYRYHHLFGEVLRARLHRRDPPRAQALDRRASTLLERRGDVDGAIRHAVRAADLERAGGLMLGQAFVVVSTGQLSSLAAWLDLVGPDVVEQVPEVAVATAWWGVGVGDVDAVRRGLAATERFPGHAPLADGTPSLSVAAAVVRAMAAAGGLEQVLRDTEVARRGGGSSVNPWWGIATLVQGTAQAMLGDADQADELLRSASEAMADAGAFEAAILAHRGLLALHRDDVVEADRLTSRGLAIAEANHVEGVVAAMVVFAARALVAARTGHADEAWRVAATANRLLARLGDLAPRTGLFGYLSLALAAQALGRFDDARTWLAEAQRARRRDGSATFLVEQLDELDRQLVGAGSSPGGAQPLTAAELRVLTYLPTHLSLQEIADQLLISRNTAKTHSVAIYRKLGAASRGEAVDTARRLGVLEPTGSRPEPPSRGVTPTG